MQLEEQWVRGGFHPHLVRSAPRLARRCKCMIFSMVHRLARLRPMRRRAHRQQGLGLWQPDGRVHSFLRCATSRRARRGGKALLFAIAVSSLGTTDGPMMHVKQTKPALSKDEGNLKSTSIQN